MTLTTLVAGLAPSGPLLIAARACQGLGAAMALPASLALVPALFVSAARRYRAFAAIAVIESAAWIVGALLGGILTAVLGWRFVFLVTIPVVVATLVLAARVLPESREARGPARPDVAGAVSVTACLALGVYSISQFEGTDPVSVPFMAAVAACFAFGCVFWVNERIAAEPLLDAALLRVRRLWGASVGVAANTAAYSATVFVGTLYLQDTGYGPTATGMFFLALSVGAFASPVFGRLLARYDARPIAFAGLGTGAVALATFALLAQLGRANPYAVVLTLLVFGIGQYGAWVALVGQATNDVEGSRYGVASGIFKTATHIGSALAVAIAATVIESTGHIADAYALAYLSSAGLTLAGAVLSVRLLRPADKRALR